MATHIPNLDELLSGTPDPEQWETLFEALADPALDPVQRQQIDQAIAASQTGHDLYAQYRDTDRLIDLLLQGERQERVTAVLDRVRQAKVVPLDPQEKDETSAQNPWRRVGIWIGVAAAVLILVLVVISNQQGQYTDKALAWQFIQAESPSLGQSLGINRDSLEQVAQAALHEEDYSTAAQAYELILEEDSSQLSYRVLLALVYLYANSPDQALPLLEGADIQQSAFYPQARWYMALAYLQQGEEAQSRELLVGLIDEFGNEGIGKKAGDLMAELDSIWR